MNWLYWIAGKLFQAVLIPVFLFRMIADVLRGMFPPNR